MRALGVSIFAGGFSIGVEKHFELVAHLERSPYGVAEWRAYRPNIPAVINAEGRWGSEWERIPQVDFVYGNPPCSPWSGSSAGRSRTGVSNRRGLDAPLLEWTKDVVRVGRELNAKVVAVESVRGAFRRGADFYRKLRDDYGYKAMQWVFVDPWDHGLPQRRPRVFMLFMREGEVFRPTWEKKDPPTICQRITGAPDDDPIAGRSIYCPPPETGVTREELMRCIPAVPIGGRLAKLSQEEIRPFSPVLADAFPKLKYPRYLFARPNPNQVPVIFGPARYIHPFEDRLLTLRELMRLQGYPDDFRFLCSQPAALTMLGKTVCPPVGEWLAREVAAYLRDQRDVQYQVEAAFDCSTEDKRITRVAPGGAPSGPPLGEAIATNIAAGMALPAVTVAEQPKPKKVRVTTALGGEPVTSKNTTVVEVAPPPPPPLEEVTELAQQDRIACSGPTALARILIAEGAGDGAILARTTAAFGPSSPKPLLFVKRDLEKLRARIARKETR